MEFAVDGLVFDAERFLDFGFDEACLVGVGKAGEQFLLSVVAVDAVEFVANIGAVVAACDLFFAVDLLDVFYGDFDLACPGERKVLYGEVVGIDTDVSLVQERRDGEVDEEKTNGCVY